MAVVAAAAVVVGALALVNRASREPATPTGVRGAAAAGVSQSKFDLTALGIPAAAGDQGAGVWLGLLAADVGVTQQQLTADLRNGQTIDEIAGAHAPTVQHDAVQAITTMLDAAVSRGVFTPAQASSLAHDASDAISQLMNARLGLASHSAVLGEAEFSKLLNDFGQTPAQIMSALRGGATLSEIAGAHASVVESDATAAVQQLLDAAVGEHVITGPQETSLLGDATDAIGQLMNAKLGLLSH